MEHSEIPTSKQQEQQNYFKIAEMLVDGKITPEQACSLIADLRDAGYTEEMDAQNEQQLFCNV
jgi:hypothetical protein